MATQRATRWTAALLGVAFAATAAQAQDASAREWNQQRGNAARSGETALEPIRAEPVETWRQKLSGPVHGEPVTWGGVVFVVAGKTSRRELYAFRADTGARLGKRGLGKGPIARIAVHEGIVIVNDGAQLRAMPHTGKTFQVGWKKPGAWRGAPCVSDGKVLAADGRLRVLDPKTGRELGGGAEAHGSVAVRRTHTGDRSIAVVTERSGQATELLLRRAQLGKDWKAPSGTTHTIGKPKAAPGYTLPVLLDAGGDTWFVWSGGALQDGSSSAFVPGTGSVAWNATRTLPVVAEGLVLGFDGKGALRGTNRKGRSFEVIPAGRMPGGARPGPASVAKGVACFGNWALEVKTDRVLWTAPKLKPATTVVPVADGRMVYGTSKGELVGIADPALTASGGGDGVARSRGFSRPEGPRPKPGADEGVLLASGELVAGSVEDLEDGRVRFTPAGGEPKDLVVEDVAVFVKGGQVVWSGEENALLQLWREHLRSRAAEEFEKHLRKLVRAKLISDGRRVFEDLRRFGISDAKGAEIEKLFGRKKEHANAARKAPKFRKAEDELRETLYAAVLGGVAWCEKRGQNGAAAALLQDCDLIIPGRDTIETRGKELIPEGFPFADQPHPGRLWVQWADEIVPSGARFLAPDDRAWGRVEGPRFAKGKCLAFRTNLLLFSTEKERAVVGSCLRNGEGAVRALQRLLNGGEPDPIVADTDRMQVRIFATRKGYMEDGHAPGWSAGVYSPGEGVSRFFVPRRGQNKEPMGRSLFDTMSHELTHHYVHTRFMGGRSGRSVDLPGFWIVEGIASFMGDQAIEMGRRGPALDDPTASSIDAAAQAFKKGKLIPIKRYLSLSQYEFARLGDKPIVVVHLKHTIQGRVLTERSLFYEQAGSLCFFLLNRCGQRGRELLIQYIRNYYRAETRKDNWRNLGFSAPEELETAYIAFLENPSGK